LSWSLADLGEATPIDVLLFTVRHYQYPQLGLVGNELARRGYRAAAIDLAEDCDGPLARAARASGLPVIGLDAYARGRYRPGLLVARSEIHRFVRHLLAHGNWAGIPTAAIAHPVVDLRPRPVAPYAISRTVLCAGPFTARRLKGPRLVTTGYPGFDELPQVRPGGPAMPLILVNNSINHARPVSMSCGRQEIRNRWMEEVEAACRAVNLPFVVSPHPRAVRAEQPWPTDLRSVYDLLAEATLLISPPSSVLLEALQMGVPCVCHRAPSGTASEVDTFDEPLGAFRNTVGVEALAEAVTEAAGRAGRARETAQAFLSEHVSATPGRTMTQRVVDELVELVNRPQGSAA